MAAPLGNQNAVKAKLWHAAVVRALRKRSKTDQLEALDELAEKFLDAVGIGDIGAFKELADRLDGKAKQQIEATGRDDGPIEVKVISYAEALVAPSA
jgi:hypothetical protein